jgi:hypothetical protein
VVFGRNFLTCGSVITANLACQKILDNGPFDAANASQDGWGGHGNRAFAYRDGQSEPTPTKCLSRRRTRGQTKRGMLRVKSGACLLYSAQKVDPLLKSEIVSRYEIIA